MKTEELVIDMNNLYVQGLIKVINDFILEEASGCIFYRRLFEKQY